jgi:hypothetical protein
MLPMEGRIDFGSVEDRGVTREMGTVSGELALQLSRQSPSCRSYYHHEWVPPAVHPAGERAGSEQPSTVSHERAARLHDE